MYFICWFTSIISSLLKELALFWFLESGAVTRERSSSHRSRQLGLCVHSKHLIEYFMFDSSLICKYSEALWSSPWTSCFFRLYSLFDLLQCHGFEYILYDLCQIYISCFELHIHTTNDLCGSCASLAFQNYYVQISTHDYFHKACFSPVLLIVKKRTPP